MGIQTVYKWVYKQYTNGIQNASSVSLHPVGYSTTLLPHRSGATSPDSTIIDASQNKIRAKMFLPPKKIIKFVNFAVKHHCDNPLRKMINLVNLRVFC